MELQSPAHGCDETERNDFDAAAADGAPLQAFPHARSDGTKTQFTLTVTQDESRPSKIQLMDLPPELVERILDFVLVIDRPVELAPLAMVEKCTCDDVGCAFSWEGHERMRHEYPTLEVLRTCQTLREIGARVCYSKNAFRFSNHYGWFVLKGFLETIGLRHANLLRDITICCPSMAAEWVDFDTYGLDEHAITKFCKRRAPPYDAQVISVLPRPVEMLPTLETLTKLNSLTLLLYSTERLTDEFYGVRLRDDAFELGQIEYEAEIMGWIPTPTTKRTIVHLLHNWNHTFLIAKAGANPQLMVEITSSGKRPSEIDRMMSELDSVPKDCAALEKAGWTMRDQTFAEYDPKAVRDPYEPGERGQPRQEGD